MTTPDRDDRRGATGGRQVPDARGAGEDANAAAGAVTCNVRIAAADVAACCGVALSSPGYSGG